VAAAGVIGFVGLMAPHIARRLVGSDYRNLMPVSAIVGAIVLIGADVIGRSAFAPRELPAGLVTAILGAPFFLGLLWHQRKGMA
jgi:iron complex transport system permease protein